MSAEARVRVVDAHLAAVKRLFVDEGRAITGLEATVKALRDVDRSPAGARLRTSLLRVRGSLAASQSEAAVHRTTLEQIMETARGEGPIPR